MTVILSWSSNLSNFINFSLTRRSNADGTAVFYTAPAYCTRSNPLRPGTLARADSDDCVIIGTMPGPASVRLTFDQFLECIEYNIFSSCRRSRCWRRRQPQAAAQLRQPRLRLQRELGEQWIRSIVWPVQRQPPKSLHARNCLPELYANHWLTAPMLRRSKRLVRSRGSARHFYL